MRRLGSKSNLKAKGLIVDYIKETDTYKIEMTEDFIIYKYCSSNDYYVDNYLSNKLYLQTASNFNDLYDTVPFISNKASNFLLDKAIKLAINDNQIEQKPKIIKQLRNDISKKHIDSIYHNLRNNHLISCFSTSFSNHMMWGHYSNGLKGFVIGYSSIDIINSSINYLKLVNDELGLKIPKKFLFRGSSLRAVHYKACRPDVSESLINGTRWAEKYRNIKSFDEIQSDDIASNKDYYNSLDEYIFTKSRHWEYEKEWRLCLPSYKQDPDTFLYDPNNNATIFCKPNRIIIGKKMPKHLIQILYTHAINNGIKVFFSDLCLNRRKPYVCSYDFTRENHKYYYLGDAQKSK